MLLLLLFKTYNHLLSVARHHRVVLLLVVVVTGFFVPVFSFFLSLFNGARYSYLQMDKWQLVTDLRPPSALAIIFFFFSFFFFSSSPHHHWGHPQSMSICLCAKMIHGYLKTLNHERCRRVFILYLVS